MRFWKEELHNIIKTWRYLVFRVYTFFFRFTRMLASIHIYLVCLYETNEEILDWFGAVKAVARGRTVVIEALYSLTEPPKLSTLLIYTSLY